MLSYTTAAQAVTTHKQLRSQFPDVAIKHTASAESSRVSSATQHAARSTHTCTTQTGWDTIVLTLPHHTKRIWWLKFTFLRENKEMLNNVTRNLGSSVSTMTRLRALHCYYTDNRLLVPSVLWFLAWLTLCPSEDSGDMLLRNVGGILLNYTALQPKLFYSLETCVG
jgi:hypothetical protein